MWFVVALLCIAVISGKFLPPVAIGSGGALGLAWSHGEVWLLDLFSVNDLTTMNRRTYFLFSRKATVPRLDVVHLALRFPVNYFYQLPIIRATKFFHSVR